MITFRLIVTAVLIIIALPMYVIGLKNVRKSGKAKRNIGDINAWKISTELAKKYPEEYRLIKKESMSVGWSLILMLFIMGAIIAGCYTDIEYQDPTIVRVSCLIAIIVTVFLMFFLRKLLKLRLKIETNFKESADEENLPIISEYLAINRVALKGSKYTLLSFLLIFIVILVVFA